MKAAAHLTTVPPCFSTSAPVRDCNPCSNASNASADSLSVAPHFPFHLLSISAGNFPNSSSSTLCKLCFELNFLFQRFRRTQHNHTVLFQIIWFFFQILEKDKGVFGREREEKMKMKTRGSRFLWAAHAEIEWFWFFHNNLFGNFNNEVFIFNRKRWMMLVVLMEEIDGGD